MATRQAGQDSRAMVKFSLHREARCMGSMGSQGPWGEYTGFLGLLTESATNWGGLKQREIYSLDSFGSQEPKDCFHLAILGEKPFHTFLLASGGCGQPPHCLGLQTHHSNPSPTFTWMPPLCLCLFVLLLRASAVLDAGPIRR